MKENLHFFFNNNSSQNMGIINVNLDGGMITERLLPNRTLNEESTRGNTKPYFLSLEQKPFEFELAFAFLNDFDENKLRELSRWLNVNYYKEFYFLDKPSYRFFVMPINDVNYTHNTLNEGYVTLTMRTNDAYAYSHEFLSQEYDLTFNSPTGTKIRVDNTGDVPIGIEMWITKYGDGDITITNVNNDVEQEFIVKNLKDQELVYINHEKEEIHSNVPNLYHFDDIESDYLKLPVGTNELNVVGLCKIQFRYRYKYLIGI